MKTRFRGTSTLSKMTNASCSSKRPDRGWSKRLSGKDTLSRQMNFRPGVSMRMQNDSAWRRLASGIGWLG